MSTSSSANSPTRPTSRRSEGVDEEVAQIDHRAEDEQDRLHRLRDEHMMFDHTEQVGEERPLSSRPPARHTLQGLDEEGNGIFPTTALAQYHPSNRLEDDEEEEAELAAALERLHHKQTRVHQEGVLNGHLDGVLDMDDDDEEWNDMHENLRLLGAMGLKAKEVREVDGDAGRKVSAPGLR